MAYIIENAQILSGALVKRQCLLIKDGQIAAVSDSARMYKYIRMDASPFIMVPAYVYTDLPLNMESPSFLDPAVQREYLLEGCTAVLTAVNVAKPEELPEKIKELRELLKDSLLDYIIGAVVSAKRLTPKLLRKCQMEKVPVVFVKTDSEKDLSAIEWSWIKQAVFPYKSHLAVIPEGAQAPRILKSWQTRMRKEKIPSLEAPVNMRHPIDQRILKKIGIIPRLSGLRQGGELSYNLYLKEKDIKIRNEQDLYALRASHLMYTVHKGRVVRAGSLFLGEPGTGEHVQIKVPSFFISDEE